MQINQDCAAVISGGTSGLGFATAARLAAAGARVAILEVNENTGKAAAESIGGLFIPTDVNDSQSVAVRWTRPALPMVLNVSVFPVRGLRLRQKPFRAAQHMIRRCSQRWFRSILSAGLIWPASAKRQ
tara:strand:- start:71 stop:454 length:384 start_codon:yes stop_codon:yes gene_type:complete